MDWYIESRSIEDIKFIGYTNLYLVGCMDDRKSTSRYTFVMGSTIVAWSTEKKPVVSLSTIEVEYKTIFYSSM